MHRARPVYLALAFSGAFTALATPAVAQQAATPGFEFTIPGIMRGPEVYGREPSNIRWSADGRWIYFTWLEPGTDWRETPKPFRVRPAAGAKPERVSRAHMDTIGPMLETGVRSADRRYRAVAYEGDLYVIDTRGGSVRRLTETLATERGPTFSADSRELFFVRDDNVYSIELASGLLRQLTDVRTGPAPRDDTTAAGQRGVLAAQQRELLEAVRDRLRADSIAKAERARRDSTRVKPMYLGRGERVAGLSVAPSGRALLIETMIPADSARRTEVPQYVTSSGYVEELQVRSKVGDAQGRGRIAFMSLPEGEVKWLRITADDTTRPAGDVTIHGWNQTGTHALVSAEARDFKTRWLHTVDAKDGALKTVDTARDSAWVGRKSYENTACIGCAGWYDGGRKVWLVSEADGFAHLYTMEADGGGRRQLTRGRWEVLDVALTPDESAFLLHTSEVSPFEVHAYRMPLTGGARERLTREAGANFVTPSPDGSMLAVVHSKSNRPPELFVMPARGAGTMAQLTTSPTAAWLAHRWIEPEIVMIRASDGVDVPARIYKPGTVGASANGAAAIFVHGAGYLHNVHRYWSTYAREYMFNQYLASRGYVVLDVDYRGSAGYSRDWRTAIYRHMGGRDLQDHVDAARYLQREHGIDPERIGIYGGSYGGFITLMALFNEPKWFGAGAALRSVTDWAHYNHGYTARILNTPTADSVAYRRSSPIYFAQGLEDPLLIAHGMVDVNVHFQDVVRLSQRLIELGKTDWEMAVYPVEDHGFVRPSSWADEYRRIFELFERELVAGGSGARAADGGGAPR